MTRELVLTEHTHSHAQDTNVISCDYKQCDLTMEQADVEEDSLSKTRKRGFMLKITSLLVMNDRMFASYNNGFLDIYDLNEVRTPRPQGGVCAIT